MSSSAISPSLLQRLNNALRTVRTIRRVKTDPQIMNHLQVPPEIIESRVKILKTPHKALLNKVLSKSWSTGAETQSELTLACQRFVHSLTTNETALREWDSFLLNNDSLPHKQLYPVLAAAALRALVETGQWPKLSTMLSHVEKYPEQSVKPYLTLIVSLSACNRQQAALKVVDRMRAHKLTSPIVYIPIIKDPNSFPFLLESKAIKPELLSPQLLKHLLSQLLASVTEKNAITSHEFAIKLVSLFEAEKVKPCWHSFCILFDTRWCVTPQQFHPLLDMLDLHRHHFLNHADALARAVLLATLQCEPYKDFQVLRLLYEWFHPRLKFSLRMTRSPSSFWDMDHVYFHMALKDLKKTPISARKRQLVQASKKPAGVFAPEVYDVFLRKLARQRKMVHAVALLSDLQLLRYRPTLGTLVEILRAAGHTKQMELINYCWELAQDALYPTGKRYFKVLCELIAACDNSRFRLDMMVKCAKLVLGAIRPTGQQHSGLKRAFGSLVFCLAKRGYEKPLRILWKNGTPLLNENTLYALLKGWAASTPPRTSIPSTTKKWRKPNHLDRIRYVLPLLRLYRQLGKPFEPTRMLEYLTRYDYGKVVRLYIMFDLHSPEQQRKGAARRRAFLLELRKLREEKKREREQNGSMFLMDATGKPKPKKMELKSLLVQRDVPQSEEEQQREGEREGEMAENTPAPKIVLEVRREQEYEI